MIEQPIAIPLPNSPDDLFLQMWQQCALGGGHLLARGTMRDVYEIPGHNLVLKVCTGRSYKQNWSEIVAYGACEPKLQLAAVESWSFFGRFLVMEKLTHVSAQDLVNYTYPSILNDRKPNAIGRASDGSLKVMDYGMLRLNIVNFPSFLPVEGDLGMTD